jgi:hypothetical protein
MTDQIDTSGNPAEKPATLMEALLAFQAECPILTKQAKGKVSGVSKGGKAYEYEFDYADYPTIMATIQPLLTKYELVWSCTPGESEQGKAVLGYRLLHVPSWIDSGEGEIVGLVPLILGANPTAQSYGSALSYAKRQVLCATLNLVAEKDDDGKAAQRQNRPTGDARPMPKAKREKMVEQIEASGKDLQTLLTAVGAESVEAVTVGQAKQLAALL